MCRWIKIRGFNLHTLSYICVYINPDIEENLK
jgi:hypothetical protein